MKTLPKTLLDERSIELLCILLEKTNGSTDGVDTTTFRTEHIKDRDKLTQLAQNRYIRSNTDNDTYAVSAYGLSFIDNSLARNIFNDINQLLAFLRGKYEENPKADVLISNLVGSLKLSENRVLDCIDYINDVFCLPFNSKAAPPGIYPTENIFDSDTLEQHIFRHLSSSNPEHFSPGKNTNHGNTEKNAEKREQILGAAIAVMAKWPDQCKRGDKFNGQKIADQIDKKSLLWWPGDPPSANSTIRDLVNKYLKTVN